MIIMRRFSASAYCLAALRAAAKYNEFRYHYSRRLSGSGRMFRYFNYLISRWSSKKQRKWDMANNEFCTSEQHI